MAKRRKKRRSKRLHQLRRKLHARERKQLVDDHPRVRELLRELDVEVKEIVSRGHVTPEDVKWMGTQFETWEDEARDRFIEKREAGHSVGDLAEAYAQDFIDRVHTLMRGRKDSYPEDAKKDVQAALDAMLAYKAKASRAIRGEPEEGVDGLLAGVDPSLPPTDTPIHLTAPPPKEDEGDGAVQTYLQCLRAFLEAARGNPKALRDLTKPSGPQGNDDVEEGLRVVRTMWARMRNARVFEIPVDVYNGLRSSALGTADRLMEATPGLKGLKETDQLRLLGDSLGMPEHMPFEQMYIGIGKGVQLPREVAMVRVPPKLCDGDLLYVNLLGYLVSEPDGVVVELLHVVLKGDDFILPMIERAAGTWVSGWMLVPWIVHGLVNLINEHSVVVLEKHKLSREVRKDIRKMSKKAGGDVANIPKPYYKLRMKRGVVQKDDFKKVIPESRKLTYRHDRRGHERCYIRRGPLPLDAEVRTGLKDGGYRIYELERLSAEDAERLLSRELPGKSVEEWMAIKTVWIDDQVIGPKDGPYVPAVRVPTLTDASHRVT